MILKDKDSRQLMIALRISLTLFLLCVAMNVDAQDPQSPTPKLPAVYSGQGTDCGPAGCITSDENDENTDVRPELRNPTANTIRSREAKRKTEDTDEPQERSTRSTQPLPESIKPIEEKPTDFEKFAEDTTGHRLPVFGRNLFLNTPAAAFTPAPGIAPPADHIVDTGDQLKIRTWGNVNIDVQASVDRNGQIFVPQVGTLTVAGMRMDQVHDVLQNAIRAQFKSFTLSVTLGQLRSIQVFVLGHARRPGVYTISSLSTLVNALFTSGGPSSSGTMRDIQVKRNGRVLCHFDVYALLLDGEKSTDIHLLPGDIIFIPLIGPQIAIDGDVTTPGIFELAGQTTAETVLQIAGGLTPVASLERASLDRIVDHSRRTVEGFPLNGPQRLVQVQGGDILRVFPITAKIEQAVTLRGSVSTPGRYPWHPGMHISDLVPTRQFLLTRNYFNQQNALNPAPLVRPFAVSGENAGSTGSNVAALSRTQAAAAGSTPEAALNTRQGDLNATQIPQSTMQEPLNTMQGSSNTSQNPLNPTQDPQSKTQIDLISHETEINWNYAVIERLGMQDLTTHLIPFALGEAIDHPSSDADKVLEAGDVIDVYSQKDVNLPAQLRASFVRIDGEVNRPGIYRLEGKDTFRDLVERAGGLSPKAYLYASLLTRESIRLSQDLKLQQLVQQESRAILSPTNLSMSADGKNPIADLEVRKAYIDALRKIHATGRVVLHLSPTGKALEDVPAFELQDGDHVFVPSVPNTVDVLGSVYSQGALRYLAGEKVHDYLDAAGGYTREGDKHQEFILRADGTILSRQRTSRFDKVLIYPGDTVVVPPRLKPGFSAYELINLSQLLSGFALSAVAIRSLQ